jgi:hypothetical protein
MLHAHYQEHAPSFIQQVPAKIREECQGWGDGPLEMQPCDWTPSASIGMADCGR